MVAVKAKIKVKETMEHPWYIEPQRFLPSRSNSLKSVFPVTSCSTRIESSFIICVSDKKGARHSAHLLDIRAADNQFNSLTERTHHEEHLALCIQSRTPLVLILLQVMSPKLATVAQQNGQIQRA